MPPQERDEDSGLHDIRNLASSTKLRLSSRRTSTAPPVDEDILASSSAGWKAVALPEPAKMVSLPSLDELPPAEDVAKADRKSKKELKAERTSASKIANAAIAVETSRIAKVTPTAAPAEVTAAAPAATPVVGARFAPPAKKSKTGLFAALGLGLAAAAGVGWYVSTQMNKKSEPAQVAVAEEANDVRSAPAVPAAAPAPTPTVEPIAPPPADPAPPASDTAVATGMAAGAAPAEEQKADDAKAKGKAVAKANRREEPRDKVEPVKQVETKPEAPKPTGEVKKAEGGEGEPSFDALLKEAGVQEKKVAKPVLEKKSLSGGDIKTGMGSVAAKAQACYQGTQGTAQVKLTVTPDGKVEKVTVSGVFAGTPVGECVAAAVKGATFPAWDGGPQTFGYSYLLAE